jgi:hypothetical protein
MIDLAGYLAWRPAFLEAIDERLYPAAWLNEMVQSGRAQFWRSASSAALTEIKIYPSGAMDLHGLVAAGDVAEVRDILVPQAEAWARAMGCIGFVIESRPGWAKLLKNKGFEPHQLAVRKEFS